MRVFTGQATVKNSARYTQLDFCVRTRGQTLTIRRPNIAFLSLPPVNKLWFTTVSAVALFTCSGWAGEPAMEDSKRNQFLLVSPRIFKIHLCNFRMKYSAATGPPVGPECEHCGQRHQVRALVVKHKSLSKWM